MGVVMPFVGYYLYRLITGENATTRRKVVASGIASYVSIVVAATLAGVQFGIQPLLAHAADGAPLYAPYPLNVAVTAMFTEHLFFFGWVEAIATMGVIAALAKQDSALLEMKPASKSLRWVWAAFAALVLLTPIGSLAQGTAWGEWGTDQFAEELHMAVPAGLERLSGVWTAAIPDYAPEFIQNPLLGYLVAAIIGSALAIGVTWGLAKLLARKDDSTPTAPPAAA
jgi:cobalt/nickel transport system permease protein